MGTTGPKKILVKLDEDLPAFSPLKNTFWETSPQYQKQSLDKSPLIDFTDLIDTIEELDLRPIREKKNHFYYKRFGFDRLDSFLHLSPPTTTGNNNQPSCSFCKKNNERSDHYESHALYYEDGKISCPIFRLFVCPLCYATGDVAHTLNYCPKRHHAISDAEFPLNKNKRRSNIQPQLCDQNQNSVFSDRPVPARRSRSLGLEGILTIDN